MKNFPIKLSPNNLQYLNSSPVSIGGPNSIYNKNYLNKHMVMSMNHSSLRRCEVTKMLMPLAYMLKFERNHETNSMEPVMYELDIIACHMKTIVNHMEMYVGHMKTMVKHVRTGCGNMETTVQHLETNG